MSRLIFISEGENEEVRIELEDGDIYQVADSIQRFLVAAGFHPKSVHKVMCTEDACADVDCVNYGGTTDE